MPFIHVDGVNLKEFRSQRVDIPSHSAIVFNNRTIIDHFFRIRDQGRIVIPETMKYLCSSEAVALYLQKYIVYRKRRIFFANGIITGLIELILKNRDEKLLVTLSEPYNPELTVALDRLGITYSRLVLSRAVSTELNGLDIRSYDMLVYYSPSEIAALIARYGTANLPLIAAFGNSTARAAVDAGLYVRVLAPTEQAPSMAKALDLFISKINSGAEVSPVEVCNKPDMEEFLRTRTQEVKPKKVYPKS